MPEEPSRPTGPLRPVELATAAVMATVGVTLTVAGWFLPHLSVIASFSVVPFGVVAERHRLRALLGSAFAAAVVSFLVAGTGSVSNVVGCAAVGGLIGIAKRRGWGLPGVLGGVVVIAPALAALSVGLLALFSALRKLVLQQIVNTWHGVRRFLDGIGSALHSAASALSSAGIHLHLGVSVPRRGDRLATLDHLVQDGVRDWWIAVAVSVMVGIAWLALLGWVFIGAVLDRLRWVQAQDRLEAGEAGEAGGAGGAGGAEPGPVPAELCAVSYRYAGAEGDALHDVSARFDAGEMVAVIGDNGSGKSTLTRILAGRRPMSGEVRRPGSAGLGRPGGTAVILQHPETQVLGVRVADDVVWGLPPGSDVDVEALLRRVGLAGMGPRETSGLSGGELQRLAVAAALARRPSLLISDEATAMVDEEGRLLLTDLLGRLAGEGMSVVHVTHRREEAERADRTYRLGHGRVVGPDGSAAEDGSPAAEHCSPADGAAPGRPGPVNRSGGPAALGIAGGDHAATGSIRLVGVSHSYAVATPWAKAALSGVDLAVEPGDGLLVVGGNGSGKSTLAWIMAGLLRPTRGECTVDGTPVRERTGTVALAFQHARLQLQRATVARDVKAAGAADDAAVAAALGAVGLDPARFADRRIDELSGGEQRRVALAGLLSRRPAALLLDEPLAGLDHPSREALIDLMASLRRDHGLTVVVISHDMGGMERICDRAVRLDGGRIVSDQQLSGAVR